MADKLTTIQEVSVLICAPAGKKLTGESEALELIGKAMRCGAEWVVLPVERLDPDFFELKTGLAGQILQKFVTYRKRLAILGDISPYLAQSRSLTSFVYEANRGRQVWFLKNLQELNERLNHSR